MGKHDDQRHDSKEYLKEVRDQGRREDDRKHEIIDKGDKGEKSK